METFVCAIEGCDHSDRGGYGWCRMHYMRWWRHGSPHQTNAGHRFIGDLVTYRGAHIRVRKRRGAASRQHCVECGRLAQHWAYDHADPHELIDPRGRRYSGDPQHYRPMCVSCHKKADLALLAAAS